MPEFYGEGSVSYRLAMVKHRENFLDLFADAAHVDAVTYGQSPSLIVQMLHEYGVGLLDVLVGNADDFISALEDADTEAEREKCPEYWVGTGDLEVNDLGALNQDATEDIIDVADTVNAVVSDPKRPIRLLRSSASPNARTGQS
jgi:hypothetical protein